MRQINKRLIIFSLAFLSLAVLCAHKFHPVFITVTEIEHNTKTNMLEVSCKFYTDDLEKTLRLQNSQHIDVSEAANHKAMDVLLKSYIQNHFILKADGLQKTNGYLGFEVSKEATYVYLEIPVASTLKKIEIQQDLLFESFEEQIGIIHLSENRKTISVKLQNPENKTAFTFPLQ